MSNLIYKHPKNDENFIQLIKYDRDLPKNIDMLNSCLLYTSDAADEEDSVDLGGRRIIKKIHFFKIL